MTVAVARFSVSLRVQLHPQWPPERPPERNPEWISGRAVHVPGAGCAELRRPAAPLRAAPQRRACTSCLSTLVRRSAPSRRTSRRAGLSRTGIDGFGCERLRLSSQVLIANMAPQPARGSQPRPPSREGHGRGFAGSICQTAEARLPRGAQSRLLTRSSD